MSVKPMCGLRCLILLAAVSAGILGFQYRDHDDRGELSDKEIRDKLDTLTNEVMQLKLDVLELRGQRNEEQTPQETAGETGLKILSVSRKSLPNSEVLYTVRYREPKDNSHLKAIWRNYEDYVYTISPETISNKIPNLPLGVRETSTTATARNDSHLLLSLGSDLHWLSLYLTDSGDDVMETGIEIPILEVAPKDDIVYAPGHNATFNVTFPPEAERGGPGSGMFGSENFHVFCVLAEPGNKNLIMSADEGTFYPGEEIKFFDKVQRTVHVDTSVIPYSGILGMTSGVNKEYGLVRRVENHKTVVLRSSTQKGPFPEGIIYLRPVLSYNEARNESGDITSLCNYGEKCVKYCQFYGDGLSTIELFKTVNGKTTPESMEILDGGVISYEKVGTYELIPEQGDPFPVTYTCRASNEQGVTESYDTIVFFGSEIKILRNESSFEDFNNGTGRVVCTAQGSPLPNMTIECNYNHYVEHQVLYQTDDVISVTATCQDWDQWGSMTCTAENDFGTDTFYEHAS